MAIPVAQIVCFGLGWDGKERIPQIVTHVLSEFELYRPSLMGCVFGSTVFAHNIMNCAARFHL